MSLPPSPFCDIGRAEVNGNRKVQQRPAPMPGRRFAVRYRPSQIHVRATGVVAKGRTGSKVAPSHHASSARAAPASRAQVPDVPAASVAESFSELTARRSMPIVSPPLPKKPRHALVVDLAGLEDAIMPRPPRPLRECVHSIADAGHGRRGDIVDPPPCVDDEPAPLFLRNPSQAFIRALFEIAGER
jgi:hypothetical protein